MIFEEEQQRILHELEAFGGDMDALAWPIVRDAGDPFGTIITFVATAILLERGLIEKRGADKEHVWIGLPEPTP